MPKSAATYWNPLSPDTREQWKPVKGLEGIAEELTLSIDKDSGEYTRLTRFHPGADTTLFGGKSHAYPEEIFIVSGRLYDQAFDTWLESGHYASRPPGEVHGPFNTDMGWVVLKISFPTKLMNSRYRLTIRSSGRSYRRAAELWRWATWGDRDHNHPKSNRRRFA